MKNPLYLIIGSASLIVVLVIGLVVRNASEAGGVPLDGPPNVAEDTGKRASPVTPGITSVAALPQPAGYQLPDPDNGSDPLASSFPQIPEPLTREAEISLWQVDSANPDALSDGNPAKRLHTNPELVKTFHVGQKLHLQIPQRNTAVAAELASTYNLTPRTQVWQGAVANGHPQDNVTVTRGALETHVTIATVEGTYSAIIDNATGDTVMVDEGDITVNQIPYEDGISVNPVEQQPPPTAP